MKLAWLLALVACRIDSLDLTGKPCPCPADWICDLSTNTCRRELDPDAAIPRDIPFDSAFDLTTGLAVHFELDQTSGQIIEDSSPTNRDGYFYNASKVMWTTGRIGGGMRFDGTEYASFVLFPATSTTCAGGLEIASSFTTSVWVRFDSFHPYNGYTMSDVAVMDGSAGGNGGSWGIGASDGCSPGTHTASATIALANNGPRINRCGSTPLAVATWYHLTGVYDASARTLDIYLNGVKDNGDTMPDNAQIPTMIQASPVDVCPYLGASHNQTSLLYGTLDEYRLYTRALTAAEVGELYRISQ